MVNGINSQSNIYALKDLVNLAKYATGVPLTNDAEKLTVGEVANYPAMLCAYDGYRWVKNNKGQYKQAFAEVVQRGKDSHNVLKNAGVKGVLRVADAKEILANIPEAEALKSLSANSQDLYRTAQKMAEVAKANPANKDALKQAASALAKADAATYAENAAKATGFFSKAKKAVGITKVTQATKDMAAKSPTFKKCLDAYNNEAGTFMLVLEGGVETCTNVIPTFKQLGFKRGMKQLGRSAVKTVASVAGWVGGSVLGSKLGDVVGAAVGNNKVGAVVGAVAGKVGSYAVGTIGQHYATQGVKKVLGKSELEKAKDEEAVRIAQAAMENPEVFEALVTQAAERLAVEGEDTAESKAVNATLRNLVAQKTQAESATSSQMMTREEMKAYADSLADNTAVAVNQNAEAGNVVTNPVTANKSGYTGYIPSAAAAPIKPQAQQPQVAVAAKNAEDEMTPELKALLAKADRVIANGSKYVDKK
ncbi:hypothetical protein IJ843_00295 [bacterium]|nr:hypothetical protein [bacterium]